MRTSETLLLRYAKIAGVTFLFYIIAGVTSLALGEQTKMTPGQVKLQCTLTTIRLNRPIDQLPSNEVALSGAYFINQMEMARRFSRFQPALDRTQEIAKCCKFDLPPGVAHMPQVPCQMG
jgi:DNA polymerase III alpha subunit